MDQNDSHYDYTPLISEDVKDVKQSAKKKDIESFTNSFKKVLTGTFTKEEFNSACIYLRQLIPSDSSFKDFLDFGLHSDRNQGKLFRAFKNGINFKRG